MTSSNRKSGILLSVQASVNRRIIRQHPHGLPAGEKCPLTGKSDPFGRSLPICAPADSGTEKSFESVKYQYCYDHLIRGNKKEILDFFDDLDKELCHLPQNDQETMQFFFALREPIYSAYILILSNEDTNENNAPAFPQYIPGYTVEQISKDYRGLCLRLCEIVEKIAEATTMPMFGKLSDILTDILQTLP